MAKIQRKESMQTNQTEILAACDRALDLDATKQGLHCQKCDEWFYAELGKDYKAGVFCPECRSHGYVMVGVCHLEPLPDNPELDAFARTFAPDAARWIKAAVEREAAKDRALEEAVWNLKAACYEFTAGMNMTAAETHVRAALAAIREVQP